MEALKVGIIESDENLLDRYKGYLSISEFSECVLAVNSFEKFIKYYRDFMQLEVILLDLGDPGSFDFKRIEKIKQLIPAANIIIFTTTSDTKTVIKTLRLGAEGYLLKDLSKVELERHLFLLRQGGAAISPPIARKILEYFSPNKSFFTSNDKDKLSKKENQITNLLLEGLTYSEISETLNISINGVRYHIKNIYKKLGVNSRAEIHNKYSGRNIEKSN